MTEIFDVAVVGGGFAGLMTVANIVRNAKARPRIFWAGQDADWGYGLAYSTGEACHLLNVRADRMGAWADGIDDFWRWLQKNCRGQFQADSFVPRMVYGAYLDDIRNSSGVPLEHVKIKSARREGDRWLLNAGKRRIEASRLVLATGNPKIAGLGWPENDVFVADFWTWRLEGGAAGSADGPLVIAGTGLTAADAVLSVLSDGFKGRIVCVSPHGQWPEVHAPQAAFAGAEMIAALKAEPSALHYLRVLRRHADAGNWRSVVDAVRPQTVALWQALPDREKSRFMRHLWSRWNVRRHRMAPEIRQRMEACGQVEIIAGRILRADADGTVFIRRRGAGKAEAIRAAKVLNCTGPSYRRMVADNPLLNALKEQGYLRAGPLGLGIATPDAPGLYAVGTLLLGERLETTAVPELRAQAALF